MHVKVRRLRETMEEGLRMLWRNPHLPRIAIHTNIHTVVEQNVVWVIQVKQQKVRISEVPRWQSTRHQRLVGRVCKVNEIRSRYVACCGIHVQIK